MIKKALRLLMSILFLTALQATAFAAGDGGADISLEGAILDTRAQVIGHTVYLPVRAVCEALGYVVTWSDKDGIQSAEITKGRDRIMVILTRREVEKNGHIFAFGQDRINIMSSRIYVESELFSLLFPVSTSYDPIESRITVRRCYENDIAVITERLESNKEYLLAAIQFPQLTGLSEIDIQNSINTLLKQSAENALKKGEQNAAEMGQAIIDGYTGAVGRCETFFDYRVEYNRNGHLSVVLTDYQYAGGAHGSTVQKAYTFELTTGKTVQLGDLMINDSGYQKQLSDAIRNEIDRRTAAGALYEFEFSKFRGLEENPEYYLSHNAIVFYFQEYAHFPYASGIQEFEISYADMKGFLKNEKMFLCSAFTGQTPAAVS